MISLFVASFFLIAGHQLYGLVIRNSGEARQRAIASDVAENYLDMRLSTISSGCVNNPGSFAVATMPAGKLVNAKVKVSTRCTGSAPSQITLVTATVQYSDYGLKEVSHARYATP